MVSWFIGLVLYIKRDGDLITSFWHLSVNIWDCYIWVSYCGYTKRELQARKAKFI